jgi:hypothetical protein
MSGDGTLTGMLGTAAPGYTQSIYYQVAPQGSRFAYVIFNKQAGTPSYTLGNRAYDDDVWLIKAVGQDADVVASADPVDDIASRLDVLLTDGVISISGRTELYLRRMSDLDYAEVVDGVAYRHSGSLFRLVYA